MRRHPVGAFLVWFFTVGQAIAFVPVVSRNVYGVELPPEPFVIAATMVGLLLPTVVLTGVVDGVDGLRRLWSRVFRLGVPLRWYALAVVGVPVLSTALTVALLGRPADPTASVVVLGLLVQMLVLLVTVNWWEEVAWAGFVQNRLQHLHGPVRAAVLTGMVFALGHISLVISDSLAATAAAVGLLVAVSIPFRFLQGWVLNRTESLFIVGLLHAAANATAMGSVLGAGVLPRLYAEEGPGGLVFPVMALLGFVVLAATRGGLGSRPAAEAQLGSAPPTAKRTMSDGSSDRALSTRSS